MKNIGTQYEELCERSNKFDDIILGVYFLQGDTKMRFFELAKERPNRPGFPDRRFNNSQKIIDPNESSCLYFYLLEL